MQVDLTGNVLDYKGLTQKAAMGRDDMGRPIETDDDVTYRDIVFDAINSQRPGEEFTPKEKITIFRLSGLVTANDKVELNEDDRKFILERADRYSAPLVCGRIHELLSVEDSAPVEEDTESAT